MFLLTDTSPVFHLADPDGRPACGIEAEEVRESSASVQFLTDTGLGFCADCAAVVELAAAPPPKAKRKRKAKP